MKIYLIYLLTKGLHPSLYALTTKKYLKDAFLSERKKDMFAVKEKDISKDEYNLLMSQNSGYILGRRGFETSSSSFDTITRTTIYLTATLEEEISVFTQADKAIQQLAKHTNVYSKYFNNKILEALNVLKYFNIYKYKEEYTDEYPDPYFESVNSFDIYGSNNYSVDSFGVFMLLFGNTIDSDKIIKRKE